MTPRERGFFFLGILIRMGFWIADFGSGLGIARMAVGFS